MRASDRPRLRRELTWKRFVLEGQDSFVFKNDLTQDYTKLDAVSGVLAEQMDGTRTAADLLEFASRTWPGVIFDEDYIADLLADFKKLKFLDDPFETNAMVAARAAQQRARIGAETFRNLLQIKIGAVNPDHFLTDTYPRVRWFFTRTAVAIGAALFLLSLYGVYLERAHLAGASYLALAGKGFTGFACVWLSTILVMFVHEFGHAYAVKHHGGKVDTIGFMFMFGLVAMYCDTSDSHLFPNRMHRVHVALAGTYTGFFLMPLSVALWWLTPPDLAIHTFAYSMLVFLGVTTIVFNYNPLIKLDGYFVLADLLDMPSLQEDAFAYLGYLFQRYVLRVKLESPVVGRRRKQILVVYGVLSLAYSIFFGVLMFLFFRRFLIGRFAFLGAIASVFLLYAVSRRAIRPAVRTGRRWAFDHAGMLRRNLAPIVGAAAILLALILLLPVPASRTIAVTLEPVRAAALVSPEPMRLERAAFWAGRRVRAGETLALLDADSMAVDLRAAVGRTRALALARESALRAGDPLAAVVAQDRRRIEESRARTLAREVERARLRAPFDGVVLSLSAPSSAGGRFEPGDTVVTIGDFSAARAVATVDELDLEDLRPGATVRVRLRAAPFDVLRGTVAGIEPAVTTATGTRYRVWMALDRTPPAPRAGLTGVARVTLPPRTAAAQVLRGLARFVRLDLWV